MTSSRQIRWGRIVLGGLFIELTMFAIVIPLNALNPQAAYYSVPFLAIATAFVFGKWAAKPLARRFVLHGVLVAVAASLMYVSMTTATGANAAVPLLYHFSPALRVLGGAAGGASAAKRAKMERSG